MQAIRWHKIPQTLLIVLTIAAATLLHSAATVHSDDGSVTIVTLVPGADAAQLAADYQVTILNGVPTLAVYRLQGSDAQLAALGTDTRVVSTEPDAPLDARPRWVDAHGRDVLSPQGGPYVATSILPDAYISQWAAQTIRADLAHTLSTGQGIVVAVLDTGIDPNHPWLAGKLVPGYDFVDNDPDPAEEVSYLDSDGDGTMDEGVGHGTHVAGIVTLAAPGASIMPVRIFDSDGVGRYFDIVQGIVYAVEHGADIINLSGSGADDLAYLHSAVAYAQANDVVLVAAGGINVLDYPASYAGVVAVGAVDAADYPQPFAVYPGDSVTVYAPGASIFSAYYDDSALYWSGNSMATPFVTAGVALLRAAGACDAACVYNIVQQAAHPVQKEGVTLGHRIDLYDMVTAVTGSSFDVTALYQVNPTDTPNDDSIQPFLQLQNNGRSLPLQEITVRYWYQTNTAVSEQFHCDYAAVGCTHLLANFVPVNDRGSTNRYLELSFTPTAGYLLGGRSSGDMMVRTNPIDHSVYDELTHYTYNAALTTYTPWEHVTVYYQDTLIWGIEPPLAAATCTIAPWSINQIYVGGDQAAYNGRLWHAKWWTQGEEPGTTGQWGVWEDQGTCP